MTERDKDPTNNGSSHLIVCGVCVDLCPPPDQWKKKEEGIATESDIRDQKQRKESGDMRDGR